MSIASGCSTDKHTVAIIGAGAVGSALALRLSTYGYRIRTIVSRHPRAAEALARRVVAEAATGLEAVPEAADVVFCCVPDDAIADVAEALAQSGTKWTGRLVAHTSGALTAGVLAPLAAQGAEPLSFHPMQTFTSETGPEAFDGIYIGVEGSAAAVAFGEQLAEVLGARPLVLSAASKTRYHLAASMASNFLVTLMAVAGEVLQSMDINAAEGSALLRPLVAGIWRNLDRQQPEQALTGPIVRGDAGTVRQHLQTLQNNLPHLTPVYAALAAETVRVAVRAGRLPAAEAAELLDLLHETLGK